MVDRYPVITLCGSTRFKNEFYEAQKRLTLEGNIVISVGLFGHSGDSEVWDEMLAICSEIDAWRDKKASEEANARYNEMLYYGLGMEEE